VNWKNILHIIIGVTIWEKVEYLHLLAAASLNLYVVQNSQDSYLSFFLRCHINTNRATAYIPADLPELQTCDVQYGS